MSFFVPTRFVWRFGGRQVRLGPARIRCCWQCCCGSQRRQPGASPAHQPAGCAVICPRSCIQRCMAVLHVQVHLCGSFTRWVETIPMAPVDGTPGVFAVVVHLPPGCVTAAVDREARDGGLLMLLLVSRGCVCLRVCIGGSPFATAALAVAAAVKCCPWCIPLTNTLYLPATTPQVPSVQVHC